MISVAGLFLAGSIALLAVAGVIADDTAPLARWDPTLGDPARIQAGVPFTIEVEARNPGTTATDPVWVVIAWRPLDRSLTPGASGRFVGCDPSPCTHRDDPAAGVTEVGWPGLAAGDRRAYAVTVSVTGVEPGDTLVYRVTTGTGADAAAVRGGLTWTLELGVD